MITSPSDKEIARSGTGCLCAVSRRTRSYGPLIGDGVKDEDVAVHIVHIGSSIDDQLLAIIC